MDHKLPLKAATNNGVSPLLSVRLKFAPFWIKISTIFSLPEKWNAIPELYNYSHYVFRSDTGVFEFDFFPVDFLN